MKSALITPEELSAVMADVKILDATYGAPDAFGSFTRAHIGHAQFFDIDAVADHSAPYPHTLPTPEVFAKAVGDLGVSDQDDVVIYDQTGITFAACRAWWMFRVMGHANVRVLNGGLPAWQMAGLPVESGPAHSVTRATFKANFRADLYRSFDDMEDTDDVVIDARNAPRFHAMAHSLDGDPVPTHIPGSINQPFQALLDERGRLRPADEIAPILLPHISPGQRLVATCGSGVTACVLALGFHQAGFPDMAVYDGSWTEWADRNGIR